MKFKIKFSETKKIKIPKSRFVYVRFTEDENIDDVLEIFGINADKKKIKDFGKKDLTTLKFTHADDIFSTVTVKKIDAEKINADFFRNALAQVIIDADKKTEKLIIDFPRTGEFIEKTFGDFDRYFQSLVEGVLLGNYKFDKYKSEKEKPAELKAEFINAEKMKLKPLFTKAENIAAAVYFARDLVNEPANVLTPQEFAKRIKAEFKGTGVKVEILTAEQLRKRKMTALLSVGQASVNPPLLVKLTYKGKKPKDKIALVGKGVMYDAGGLSLKPTSSMLDMKGDMAGAAAVAGILKAASSLELPFELYGVIPVVENVISGNAYKPGDILKTSSGKTIEIGNTDAEGRLILADALEFAEKLKPNKIFDFATLTGACVVALGESYAGLFTESDDIAKKILQASDFSYEKIWRMPMPKEYDEMLKSELADISNIGNSRWGGAITAALFLKFFVSEEMRKNWAHFDIAGPALKHNQSSYTKKYATGYGVRLITEYLQKAF